MTDLEMFQSLRPQIEPLSVGDRAAMRHDLFGSDTSSTTGHVSSVDESGAVDDDLVVRSGPAPHATDHRMLLAVAAILVAVIGVAGVWLAADRPETAAPPLAQPPSSTTTDSSPVAQPPQAPVWYDTIRPLLPEGFDQIVLTDASPEVVGFKAFRTGTRQLLDVTVTLHPGEGLKDTGEAVTFSDDHGDYVESTSAVALTTPDQRRVVVRCGLSPLGGGAVGSVSFADAARDYCGDGFDNLDVDRVSRRALAARLADEFPTAVITPAFGQPDTSPVASAITEIVNDFVGESREFGTVQADGVLRVVNLSPRLGEPSITKLTVMGGIWPPHGDGSAFDDRFANSPHGRFFQYDDLAVALVVVDGTGYHIATTDVRQEHLTQLSELLIRVVEETADSTGA